jgi:hypothetical protein
MASTRLNLGIVIKGDFNDLQALKEYIESIPEVTVAFSTFSGDKLFVYPHRRGGEHG